MRLIAPFVVVVVLVLAPPAPARSLVPCSRDGGITLLPVERPRQCVVAANYLPLAYTTRLSKLRWSSWGARLAFGRGYATGPRLDDTALPVRVRLARRRTFTCRLTGDRVSVYFEVRLTYVSGNLAGERDTIRLPRYAATAVCGD